MPHFAAGAGDEDDWLSSHAATLVQPMASVLAIVSKAIFEEDFPTAQCGKVLGIDRYVSKHPSFSQLGKGDAIFLFTVRRGASEKDEPWLVAILEKPAKKGKAWVGKKNTTPVRDITSIMPKLVFSTGKGIGLIPEQGMSGLGMTLQTPRKLTDADVALLRGEKSGGLELVNHRRPFELLAKLPAAQKKQLAFLTKKNRAGTPEDCVDDEDWASMELVDVRDQVTKTITHQLYAWPYGSAALFPNDSAEQAAAIIQHAYQMSEGDLELRCALAAAYAAAPIGDGIDFRLDEVWKKPVEAPPVEKKIGLLDAQFAQQLKKGELDGLLEAFDAERLSAIVFEICTADDPHDLFDAGRTDRLGETSAQKHAVKIIRILAELLDRAGAATTFAERALATKQPHFWLAAIATFALARQKSPFPKRFYTLAEKADFLGHGVILGDAMREVVARIPEKDREAFIEKYVPNAGASTNTEVRKGRDVEVPVLLHRWLFADLVPTESTAKALVDDMEHWDNDAKPVKQALAIIKALGPICAPYLRKAIKKTKSRHKKVLERALVLVSE
jgi:hypothetical protein